MTDTDTAVLKFVRGIDFSKYKGNDWVPNRMCRLSNLRWLKLNDLDLSHIPQFLNMEKLESLSMVNNKISTIGTGQQCFDSLTTLNVRKNNIGDAESQIVSESIKEILTLDLSYNKLITIPLYLESMKNLVALNLSNNSIKELPQNLFSGMNKLVFLDLSHNQIQKLPSSIVECISLQIINFSCNPLIDISCDFSAFIQLKSLTLSENGISDHLLFSSLSNLKLIAELDLSSNNLTTIPDVIFQLKSLLRFNISKCNITDISDKIGKLISLRYLNLSFNQITQIPEDISKLSELRHIYINGNLLTSTGIPNSISQLLNLEVFMAAFNYLDTIPPGLCRCIKLRKLILRNNRLLSLPDAIYNLKNIELLDTKGNPDLVMPRRTPPSNDIFSNMDFSYDNVKNMVVTLIKQLVPPSDIAKENLHKEKLLVHKKTKIQKLEEIQNAEANKIIGKSQNSLRSQISHESECLLKKPPREIFRPQIEFTDIFPEEVGSTVGVTMYQIENFLPAFIENNNGVFFTGDCYVILNTTKSESLLNHKIFFWIGDAASIDKKACAAMHAVHLRNLLGVDDRTYREEQNDESDEFRRLFTSVIRYEEGCGTACSFFQTSVEEAPSVCLYRMVSDSQGKSMTAVKTELKLSSLDPRFAFMMIKNLKIFLWFGSKINVTVKNKSRLLAEKISKVEKKGEAEIIIIDEGRDDYSEFWVELGGKHAEIIESLVYDEEHLKRPIIYKLNIGPGYLELPQVHLPVSGLKSDILLSDAVYIFDFWYEIYVWSGKDTSKIAREAAKRLSDQVKKFFNRPEYVEVETILEGYESMVFKSKFIGWNDVLNVDYTLSAESISNKRKVAPKPAAKSNAPKVLTHEDFNLPKMEIANIFLPRQPIIGDEECIEIIDEVSEDLQKLDIFVFEDRKFKKMDESEVGHFYSHDCYVFLCRNIVFLDTTVNESQKSLNVADNDEQEQVEKEQKTDTRYKVYFWEGRHCLKNGFLNFAFTLQKKFEELFGDKLTIERIKQQQEPLKFLALFPGKFIYHRGKRPTDSLMKLNPTLLSTVRMYQIRSTMGMITHRCVECDIDASFLCSKLCYIVLAPSDDPENFISSGDIFLWIGNGVSKEERTRAEETFTFYQEYRSCFTPITIEEGQEPENFWSIIGGKKPYSTDGLFTYASRLFRCSNESGFYSIKEKCADICQDDLNDDDVMMLDTGKIIYLWVGSSASSTEIYFTGKIAPIFAQNCLTMKFNNPRQIVYTKKGQEPIEFKEAFQGFETKI